MTRIYEIKSGGDELSKYIPKLIPVFDMQLCMYRPEDFKTFQEAYESGAVYEVELPESTSIETLTRKELRMLLLMAKSVIHCHSGSVEIPVVGVRAEIGPVSVFVEITQENLSVINLECQQTAVEQLVYHAVLSSMNAMLTPVIAV